MTSLRLTFNAICVAACMAIGLPGQQAQAQGQGAAASKRQPMASGLIVKFKEHVTGDATQEATMQSMRAMAKAEGLAIASERATGFNARVMRAPRPMPAAALTALARRMAMADPNIEFVEPNLLLRSHFTPTDPWFPSQWSLRSDPVAIKAEAAWDLARGSGIRVAIVDTGVLPHADIVPNLLPGYDFISDEWMARDGDGRDSNASDYGNWQGDTDCWNEDASDSNWHGTHVAGIVAAANNNGVWMSGVAPSAKIVPVRVLGRCGGDEADTLDGALWAAGFSIPGAPKNANPAQIINMSLGSPSSCSSSQKAAFQKINNAGVLVVASAGNDNSTVEAPANCPHVIAVAATDGFGDKAWFSNKGPEVALAAPGTSLWSLSNTGTTTAMRDALAMLSGTSQAAPHVAGVLALMASSNSTLPLGIARTLMLETTSPFPGTCNSCGKGLLNAETAVKAARAYVAEREGNNSLAVAQVLATTPQLDIWGTINDSLSADDEDFYLLALPPRQNLRADLLAMDSQYDYELSLFDRNGLPLASSKKGANGVNEVLAIGNTSTSAYAYYYLKVHKGPTALRSLLVRPYRLKVARSAM